MIAFAIDAYLGIGVCMAFVGERDDLRLPFAVEVARFVMTTLLWPLGCFGADE